ncbi:MAG: hypothetical protein INH41_14190 [Myxococcaceae bacterium]|jgi:hypothetical protein|nr:hypothetical protein [Myxococcaceae bacterium]MCA3013528.1 hypothetical protein [Myxococcaceae bacterium]
MLSCLVAVAVVLGAEAGPVAVVATSKRPGAEALGPKVAARVLELLRRESVSDTLDDAKTLAVLKAAEFPDPRACNGGKKCSQRLALLLGPRAVLVSVDVAKFGKSLTIHLEAHAAAGGDSLAVADVTAAADAWKEQSAVGFITFARELARRLAPAPPPSGPVAKADAPREAPLTSAVTPPPVEPRLTEAPAPKGPRTGAFLAAGAGAAGLLTAGVLALVGLGEKAALDRRFSVDAVTGQRVFSGTRAELAALENGVNGLFSGALVSLLLGAALGGLGAWLFFED